MPYSLYFTYYTHLFTIFLIQENGPPYVYDHRADLYSAGVTLFATIREDGLNFKKLAVIAKTKNFQLQNVHSKKHVALVVSFLVEYFKYYFF